MYCFACSLLLALSFRVETLWCAQKLQGQKFGIPTFWDQVESTIETFQASLNNPLGFTTVKGLV
jgi:hypothetical protein